MTILTAEDRVNRRWLHLNINTLHVTSKISKRSTKRYVCFRPGFDNEYVGVQRTLRRACELYTQKKFLKKPPLTWSRSSPTRAHTAAPQTGPSSVSCQIWQAVMPFFLLSMTAQYWLYRCIYINCLFSTWCGLIYQLPSAMVRFRPRVKLDSDWNFADKLALLLRRVHAHTLICQYFSFLFITSIAAANISSGWEKLEDTK